MALALMRSTTANHIILAAIAAICWPQPAAADDDDDDDEDFEFEDDDDAPLTELPGAVTLDRFDNQTKIAVSASYVSLSGDAVAGTGIRFDAHFQYVAQSGIGGYVSLPVNYLSLDTAAESTTALGNVELGGLYLLQTKRPIILRGGLTVATADEAGMDDMMMMSPLGAAFIGQAARTADGAQAVPFATWLRASAHPFIHAGNYFYRADVGVDIPIGTDEGTVVDTMVRLNGAIGTTRGKFAFLGELVNAYTTNGDLDDQLVTTIAATARWLRSESMHPSLTVVVPLDDSIGNFIDFVVVLGLEYVLPPATPVGLR